MNRRGRGGTLDYSKITISVDKIDAAARIVAGSAKDADDARILLEHLGLMPDQREWYSDGDDS